MYCICGWIAQRTRPWARPLVFLANLMHERNIAGLTRSGSVVGGPGQPDEKSATEARHSRTRDEKRNYWSATTEAIPARKDICSEYGINGCFKTPHLSQHTNNY